MDIINFLASNPFVNITMTAKYLSITRQTAATYLKSLAEGDNAMLKSVKVGRDLLYFSPKFISLLS
jgi:predicted transcriptional regulator